MSSAPVKTPVTRWLRANRGSQSQAELVADLERVTGWSLLRENYSKYETGRHAPEPDTLARFIAYWATKGIGGPDFTPESEPPPPVDPVAAAIDRQTAVLTNLAAGLREVQDLRDRVSGLESLVASQLRTQQELVAQLARLVPPATAE